MTFKSFKRRTKKPELGNSPDSRGSMPTVEEGEGGGGGGRGGVSAKKKGG